MFPLSVAVVVAAKEIWDELQSPLQDVRVLFEQPDLAELRVFLERVDRMAADIVLLDAAAVRQPLDTVIRAIRGTQRQPHVFVLHTGAQPELILTAMRAGATEYLYPPFAEQLTGAFARIAATQENAAAGKRGGRTVAFLSAKGGCGATTLACHAAVRLADQNCGRVLLADLDLSSGLVGFLMKSKSPYSVADAANNVQRLDGSYWKALISNGIPNLELITAPTTPAAKSVPSSQLRYVLSFARTQYDWVVVDLGRSVDQHSLTILESVDTLFLVTTIDVPALHQAKNVAQILADSGFGRDKIKVILNRVPKRSEITQAEIEQMLGVKIDSAIGEDAETLSEAYADGKLAPDNSDIGRQITRFTKKIAGIEDSPKKRFSLFG